MDDIARSPAAADPVAGEPEREGRRDSLYLLATLHLPDEAAPREVRIRNLSERGLMAEVGRDVAVGTEARITLRGIGDVSGQVAWSVDDRIGIALGRSIDPRRARMPVGSVKAPPRR